MMLPFIVFDYHILETNRNVFVHKSPTREALKVVQFHCKMIVCKRATFNFPTSTCHNCLLIFNSYVILLHARDVGKVRKALERKKVSTCWRRQQSSFFLKFQSRLVLPELCSRKVVSGRDVRQS